MELSTSIIRPIIIDDLPNEIMMMIFDWSSHGDLARAARVCHRWSELVKKFWNDPYPPPKTAFTINDWTKHFGKEGTSFEDKQPFTRKLNEFFKDKVSTGIPLLVQIPTFNGQGLDLDTIEALFKSPKEGTPVRLDMWDRIEKVYGETKIPPGWIQLTPTVIEGTRDKPKSQQITVVAEYAKKTKKDYRLPKVNEAVMCIGLSIVGTGKCDGYAIAPRYTVTRCEEEITHQNDTWKLEVGGASPSGLRVFGLNYDYDSIGAAGALRTVL